MLQLILVFNEKDYIVCDFNFDGDYNEIIVLIYCFFSVLFMWKIMFLRVGDLLSGMVIKIYKIVIDMENCECYRIGLSLICFDYLFGCFNEYLVIQVIFKNY